MFWLVINRFDTSERTLVQARDVEEALRKTEDLMPSGCSIWQLTDEDGYLLKGCVITLRFK